MNISLRDNSNKKYHRYFILNLLTDKDYYYCPEVLKSRLLPQKIKRRNYFNENLFLT
jgi:hypothetical protein